MRPRDTIGFTLFLIGSGIETAYDIMRDIYKEQPSNKGKPYLDGLAKHVVHPNYFGYLMWRTGLSMMSGSNIWTLITSAWLSFDFIYSAIPNLQNHNKEKYGQVYKDYLAKTKNLIPYVW